MSKYVIEIPDDVQYVLLNGKADHKYYTAVHPIAVLEELNSNYINKHYEGLQDEAYQRGLDDAWEAAKKIANMWTRIDNDELLAIFGIHERIGHSTIRSLFEKQTANEAIEKLKTYEEKKADDEIKVGDEVEDHTDSLHKKAAVWSIKGDVLRVIAVGGETWMLRKNNAVRTDRHFNIDKILEEMKE